MTGIFSVVETIGVYILSGPSMNYGQPKAHASLSHLFTEAVSNFVEEMLSYIVLLREQQDMSFFGIKFWP